MTPTTITHGGIDHSVGDRYTLHGLELTVGLFDGETIGRAHPCAVLFLDDPDQYEHLLPGVAAWIGDIEHYGFLGLGLVVPVEDLPEAHRR